MQFNKNMRDNKIIKLIQQVNIVSFDLFDTLIVRNVSSPEDVFYDVGMKYYKDVAKAKLFQKRRKQVEFNLKRSICGEISFDEIYDNLKRWYPLEINQLKKMECEYEQNIISINPIVCELYEYCIKKEKEIIIVSDMYFSRPFMEQILRMNAIQGFNDLIISCEWNETKSSGRLWKMIRKQNDYKDKKILHIGNSLKGDYLFPRMNGIDSLFYIPKGNKFIYGRSFKL